MLPASASRSTPGAVGCERSWLWPSQCSICQYLPVSILLPLLTTAPVVPLSTRDAGEGVVELVDELHVADAHGVDLVEPAVDLVGRALGLVVVDAAVEELGDLDAEHHGELALVDHAPRLERGLDDPEPALARPAALGVDVVLELVDALVLEAHAIHLVARVLLVRIDLAQHRVVDQQVHEHAWRPGRSARATCSSSARASATRGSASP